MTNLTVAFADLTNAFADLTDAGDMVCCDVSCRGNVVFIRADHERYRKVAGVMKSLRYVSAGFAWDHLSSGFWLRFVVSTEALKDPPA